MVTKLLKEKLPSFTEAKYQFLLDWTMALYEVSWQLGNGRHPAGLAGAIMVVAVAAAAQQGYAREDRRKIGLRECQKMADVFGVHKFTVFARVKELRGILINIGRSNLADAVDKLHEDADIDVWLFDLMEHVQRLNCKFDAFFVLLPNAKCVYNMYACSA